MHVYVCIIDECVEEAHTEHTLKREMTGWHIYIYIYIRTVCGP